MSNIVFPAQVRGSTYSVVKTQENSVMSLGGENFAITRALQAANPRWAWRLEYSVLFDDPLKPNSAFSYTDLKQLAGFCQSMYNSLDDFLYLDPDDNFVGPGVITTAWQANYPYMLGSIVLLSGHAIQVITAPAGARSGLNAPTVSGTFSDGGLTWQDLGVSSAYPNPQAQLQVVTDGTNFYSPIQRNLGGQFYEDITDLVNGITVYDNGTLTTSYIIGTGLSFTDFTSYGLYINWGTSAPTGPVTATFNFYFRVKFSENDQDFEKFVNLLWAVGGEQGVQGKGYLHLESIPNDLNPSAPGPGGAPFPPFTNCGTNLLILHPTQISLNQGSTPGITGYAAGIAGPNAWFLTELRQQGLGSSGGFATLSNYPDPGIPRSRICAVYSYTPYSHLPAFAGSTAHSLPFSSMMANGFTMIGGLTGFDFSTYILGGGSLVPLIQGSVTISNLDFSTISQRIGAGASVNGFYGDKVVGNPMVLVYYT